MYNRCIIRPARCFVSVFWKILGKNVEVSFLRAGMACLPPKSTRRIRPPGVKTSEDTLRQNAGILFSEINCKQIANGIGEKCGGPAGHEIGEENREISGKRNALRPCMGGERISVLVNYGRNAP